MVCQMCFYSAVSWKHHAEDDTFWCMSSMKTMLTPRTLFRWHNAPCENIAVYSMLGCVPYYKNGKLFVLYHIAKYELLSSLDFRLK